MVTRNTLATQSEYVIRGIVVDRASQRGVPGVRVEAWDRDTRYHDLLGQVVTDEEGRFSIGYDAVFFGDFAPDRSPDVFFKVWRDGVEVLSTFDQTRMNVAAGAIEVRLELDLPQLQVQGRDRVSAEQTLKAVDWWRASDFAGVAREGADKMRTVGRLFSGFATRLQASEWTPVRPSAAHERDIVNQDVSQAQRALALQQVEVTQVRTVKEAAPDRLRLFTGFPVRLKAGDRVTLYEQDGVVQYYTRDAAPAPAPADEAAVARIDGDLQSLKSQIREVDALRTDVANLRTAGDTVGQRLAESAANVQAREADVARLEVELNDVRRATALKDAEIAQLRADLTAVRSVTDTLATRIPLSRLEALEVQVGALGGLQPVRAPSGAGRTTVAKTTVAKSTVAGATGAKATGAKATGAKATGAKATVAKKAVAKTPSAPGKGGKPGRGR